MHEHHKKLFVQTGSKVIATVDGTTIRHSKCAHLISDSDRKRCEACEQHRRTLHSMLARKENHCASTDKTAPSSHVNHRYLSSPEKADKIQRLHKLQRYTKQQLDCISARLSQNIQHNGLEVEDDVHADLVAIVQENSNSDDTTPFKKLFWEQQRKAASLNNTRSMRWHPLMIKWCLYLRHLSSRYGMSVGRMDKKLINCVFCNV